MTQEALRYMAKTFTKPYQGVAYQDPQHVKVCFQIARDSGTSEAWKRALLERDRARREWRESRIEAATQGDWCAFRETKKRGANGWEAHFAASVADKGVDAHEAVHAHFAKLYAGARVPPFPFRDVPRSADFSLDDLHEALSKGKRGKANGIDEVSHELLVAIGKQPQGEMKLLEWFNRLLHGEEMLPRDWGHAVMVLLPKCDQPEDPKELRPICLGSAANKVFARMLLSRTRAAFRYSGPFQNMGEGRQTIDHIWTIARMMALEQEWKGGLWFLKIDIQKAFDSLDRGRFLGRLQDKLGRCEELRLWWDLFLHTEAGLSTAWGHSVIPMASGIRQGSVESPQVFASVMDWIMADVSSKYGWDPKVGGCL